MKTIKESDALSKILKTRRIEKGWSQQNLVDNMDIQMQRRTYGTIESKFVVPNIWFLNSIAKALELDILELSQTVLDMLTHDIDLSTYTLMKGDYSHMYAYGYYINTDGLIYKEASLRPNGKFVSGGFISPYKMTHGYLGVNVWLTSEKSAVEYHHRLMGINFINNIDPETNNVINHINGIKDDNSIDNLEWTTSRENFIHALDTGLTPHGVQHGSATISEEDVIEIYLSSEYPTALSKKYGISTSQIERIKRKLSWVRTIDAYIEEKKENEVR